MGFFDGGFGAIVGAAAGLAGNALSGGVSAHSQYKYAKRLMKFQRMQNQEYAQWSAEKLPMMNRTGMENAGFNPLLAINQGTGQQGSVSPTPISGQPKDFSNLGNIVTNALDFYSRMQDISERRKLVDSQVALTNARTAQTLDNIENPKDLVTFMQKNLPAWFNSAKKWSESSGFADRVGDMILSVTGMFNKLSNAKELIKLNQKIVNQNNASANQYKDPSTGFNIYTPFQ